MKSLLVYVPTIIISGALAAILAMSAVHGSQIDAGSLNADAAFRDGVFMGHLDADRGRKPHLACGRWRTDADRRSFVSGYVEAYRERQGGAASGLLRYRLVAEQRGYYDGVADGLQQHREFYALPLRQKLEIIDGFRDLARLFQGQRQRSNLPYISIETGKRVCDTTVCEDPPTSSKS